MNKFLKGFNVLLLSALTGSVAHGKAVDENTAKLIGCNQLISVNAKGVSNPSDLTTAYVATSQTAFGVIVDYYVFNIQGGIGFVMISADDNIIPVLAYSTESSFDYSRISPAAKDWVDGYKNEIAASITTKYPAQEGTAEKWAALKNAPVANRAAKTTAVAKLVNTTWDQAPGYNNNCPVPGGGSSSTPSGCVATATAQVMRYWSWPTVGSGYHTYTHPTYGVQKADFGDTAYNWKPTFMPLASSTTHVANLMYHVGVAVNMNYKAGESGAYTLIKESPITNCSEYALKTYFHYKRSIHGVQRYSDWSGVSTIPAGTWATLLKTDIDSARPILYSGHGSAGGHAWVCDGYDASNKFHFNWGWGGSGPDGFYSVDNLNPPSLGIGGGGGAFNTQQAVIMGIEPDSFSAVNDNMKLNAHVDHKVDMPAAYPVSAFSVNTAVVNTNATAYNGDFALQVYDTALKYLFTFQTITGKSIPAGGSLSLTFSTTTTLWQLVPGYYKLRVLYRPTGGSTWSLVGDNGTFINENAIVVNNSAGIELATAITLSTGTGAKIGAPLTINAKILNGTTSTFNGDVKAVFTNVTTGTQTTIGALASDFIFSGSSGALYAFTTPSVSVPAGVYAVSIQHKAVSASGFSYAGSDLYQNPVLVTVGYGGVGVNTPSIIADNIKVYPNPANDVMNIVMDGAPVSRITITDIQGRQLQELIPDAVQSVITVPVNNYAAGVYFVNLFSGEEVVTKKIVVTK